MHWDVVSAVLGTRFGTVWLLQAGLASACAVLLVAGRRIPVLTVAALAPAAAMLLTPALSGHASVSGKIAFVTDVAHVTSAAVWVGGLAALVLALLWAGRDRWPLAADAVPRFSGIAVVAVSWLIASGTISGYLQVRALRGLWETTYGQLLLLKLGLVLPLLLLGLYNNQRAVPRLREQIASNSERTRFLRIAGAELALMVAIVSVTAVLVSEPPARATYLNQERYGGVGVPKTGSPGAGAAGRRESRVASLPARPVVDAAPGCCRAEFRPPDRG